MHTVVNGENAKITVYNGVCVGCLAIPQNPWRIQDMKPHPIKVNMRNEGDVSKTQDHGRPDEQLDLDNGKSREETLAANINKLQSGIL